MSASARAIMPSWQSLSPGISDCQEGIIALAEADIFPIQFLLDEVVSIQVVGCLKGKIGSHPHPYRAQHLVTDIEVVVGEAATLLGQNAIVGIGGRVLGDTGAEGVALLHALENEVDAVVVPPFHLAQLRSQIIFLAHAFLSPLDRDLVITGVSFYPGLILLGAP